MIRRVVFWLLLISQLSIGVIGARAAEISVLTVSQLLAQELATTVPPYLQIDLQNDPHSPWQISQAESFDPQAADTVRPRKIKGLSHVVIDDALIPAACLQRIIAADAVILTTTIELNEKANKQARFSAVEIALMSYEA